MSRPTQAVVGFALALVALAAVLGGCTSGQRYEIEPTAGGQRLAVRPTVAVYEPAEGGQAELFLTDIPADLLDPASVGATAMGSVVRVQMIIEPRAGRTPRNHNATTCTVEHVVLAGREIGLYGGGGYLSPSGSVGDNVLAATIRGATVRLLRSTPGLSDRLGPARLNADVAFNRDRLVADALRSMVAQARAQTAARDPSPAERTPAQTSAGPVGPEAQDR